MTNDGRFAYAYDAENRLVSATPLDPQDGDTKTDYGYDFMSRRFSKNVSVYSAGSWSVETEKLFVYDGWNLIKEITTTGDTTTEYYVWGLDLSGSLHGAGGIPSTGSGQAWPAFQNKQLDIPDLPISVRRQRQRGPAY